MNSKNVLSALERFKDRSADEVFDLIFSMIREETAQGNLTPEENELNACIRSDKEYFRKFSAYQGKFMTLIRHMRIIEDLFLLEPQEDISDRLHRMILYLYCDLSELLAKKSFECGVEYGTKPYPTDSAQRHIKIKKFNIRIPRG